MRTSDTLGANCVLAAQQSFYLTTKTCHYAGAVRSSNSSDCLPEIATIKTRYRADHQLAVQMGFLRVSGQLLNSPSLVPARVLSCVQLQIKPPQIAAIRALYTRRRTLHEHPEIAKRQLGFRSLTDHAERMLVAHLRKGSINSVELVLAAKQGVYEHGYVVPSQRRSLDVCRAVGIDHEGKLLSCRKITRFARAGGSSKDHHRRWTTVCHRTD